LAGTQFTDTSALVGNDISTLPDFPAEIRAPAGTLAGVSGYQVHFSSTDIFSRPGDEVDALVAMNPAALKTNLKSSSGGIVIVNEDSFDAGRSEKGRLCQPIRSKTARSRLSPDQVPINKLTAAAAKETGPGRQGHRPLQEHVRPGPGAIGSTAGRWI
jgi:2-oxoglutarate ferredoxin oxidoreductase subunit alpha